MKHEDASGNTPDIYGGDDNTAYPFSRRKRVCVALAHLLVLSFSSTSRALAMYSMGSSPWVLRTLGCVELINLYDCSTGLDNIVKLLPVQQRVYTMVTDIRVLRTYSCVAVWSL